jgi:hypothetical protein
MFKFRLLQLTIGIELGDVWSHYYTLNEEAEVVDRGRFRTARLRLAKHRVDEADSR